MHELKKDYENLHRLALDVRESALELKRLARAGSFERGDAFRYRADDTSDPINRSIDITEDFEFLVAVTGAFSSGKSTLLNVLLEYPDLLPASAIPLTAVCTVIRHGNEPRMRVRYVPLESCFERVRVFFDRTFKKPFSGMEDLDEARESPERFLEDPEACRSLARFATLLGDYDRMTAATPSFDERHRFICGGGILRESQAGSRGLARRHFLPTPAQEREYLEAGGSPDDWVTREWLALVQDVTLWVDSPLLLDDIAFLDLPGLNCREDYHRRAIQSYCNKADCVIVTAFQPGNQADEDVVRGFKALSSNFREKLFFVFNRVDQFRTEPNELVRSLDYLQRDCIGEDFPRERCFITSAYLARESMLGDESARSELETIRDAFDRLDAPAEEALLARCLSTDDPGGVGYLRSRLEDFLGHDAFRAKMTEVVRNLAGSIDRMREAAAPEFENALTWNEDELRSDAVFTYFRSVERLVRSAVSRFRYDYVRAGESVSPSLRGDLKTVLERVHRELRNRIVAHFGRPIPTAPPREDPVAPFDLRRVGEDASAQLRREFQELVVSRVFERIRSRFVEALAAADFEQHAKNLFAGSADARARLDAIMERFAFALRHSTLCAVRDRFHAMPGGKDLERLNRTVGMGDLKTHLIEVFSEFYPDWIYQHVYSRVQDELWLSIFLDAEDLESELRAFFAASQGGLAAREAIERVRLPEDFAPELGGAYEVARVCRRIEALGKRLAALAPAGALDATAERIAVGAA